MQVASSISDWSTAVGHFVALYQFPLAVGALVVIGAAMYAWIQWPGDTNGNGITIGAPKAFDNRALALRLEQLTKELDKISFDTARASAAIESFQGQTVAQQTTSISLDRGAPTAKAANSDADGKTKPTDTPTSGSQNSSTATKSTATLVDFKPAVGLAAPDILATQMELAAEIFNLQMLYERSLSDRLIDGKPRIQTVLGFQVSITPGSGYEGCVAMAEIAVRARTRSGAYSPVSIVALMPQRKSYNEESISDRQTAVTGSTVAKLFRFGFGSKSQQSELYIHRDTDTIAFERLDGGEPTARTAWPEFSRATATIFGWEFRPVLGRSTVAAGARQVLAVVALPETDEGEKDVLLELTTRSYWRRYSRKRQTSRIYGGWLPWAGDRSATQITRTQQLQIPTTQRVQRSLAPAVAGISWVSSGSKTATVIVTGNNFFSGTKVLIGDRMLDDKSGTMTLKSDQALEFQTTLDSLTSGAAVLIGRYGPSQPLVIPPIPGGVAALSIEVATIRPMRNSKVLRISASIFAQDKNGNPVPFTVAALKQLPDPILFVGGAPLPPPYDYQECGPETLSVSAPTGSNSGTLTQPYLRVEAWVSSKQLSANPSVAFRIPFCGFDFQASKPLSFAETSIQRLGTEGENTIFRIYFPQIGPTDFSVELDQTYYAGTPQLRSFNQSEYLLSVPSRIIDRFETIVVREGKGEPSVFPLPRALTPAMRVLLDEKSAPPQVAVGTRGPIEWQGLALDCITSVSLMPSVRPDGSSDPAIPQQFATYAGGTKLVVHLEPSVAIAEGKVALECTTSYGAKLSLPLFVVAARTI